MNVQKRLEQWKALASADLNQAASEFAQLSSEDVLAFSRILGTAYLVNVASQLETDAAVEFIRNLPEPGITQILEQLSEERASALRELLSYSPGTAGALMAKEYLSVPVTASLGEAIHYLQGLPQHKKGRVSYIYVVDENRRLEGVIQIRDMLFHPAEMAVRSILKKPVVQVETGMTQVDVARLLQRHRYLALPVVDVKQRLVGVISADSAMRAVESEAVDDIAKLIGTGAEEIRTHSIRKIMRLRLPWLFVNLASGLLCAVISGYFHKNMAAVAVLFFFVPVVLGLSESVGVQGATLIVRNLALGPFTFSGLKALVWRETLVGILIGLICGLVVGFVGAVWLGNFWVGVALGASMIFAIIVSAVIGLILPLIFRRLKFDPALASGPFVLAVCDIQTLIAYFTLSSVILSRFA